MQMQFCQKTLAAINEGLERGDSVAELEAIGLSQRIINALEDSDFQIIYVRQLLNHTILDLASIPNVGLKAINQIYDVLSRYDELNNLMLADASA